MTYNVTILEKWMTRCRRFSIWGKTVAPSTNARCSKLATVDAHGYSICALWLGTPTTRLDSTSQQYTFHWVEHDNNFKTQLYLQDPYRIIFQFAIHILAVFIHIREPRILPFICFRPNPCLADVLLKTKLLPKGSSYLYLNLCWYYIVSEGFDVARIFLLAKCEDYISSKAAGSRRNFAMLWSLAPVLDCGFLIIHLLTRLVYLLWTS